MSLYPKLDTAEDSQDKFNLSTVNTELRELVNLKCKFNIKYEKYNKILEQLIMINGCSSALTISSGIGSIATGATLIGIPISAGLGGVALFGSIASCIITALIKLHKKKITKAAKLYDIVTAACEVFETTISHTLDDGKIDYKEFQVLQVLYYKVLRDLSTWDKKMEVESRSQFEKNMMSEMLNLKKTLSERSEKERSEFTQKQS